MIHPCFSRSRGRGAGVDQLPVALKDLLRHADAEDAKSQASAHLRTAFKLMQHELDPIHRANTDNLGPRVDPFEVSLTPIRKAHLMCKLTIPIQHNMAHNIHTLNSYAHHLGRIRWQS